MNQKQNKNMKELKVLDIHGIAFCSEEFQDFSFIIDHPEIKYYKIIGDYFYHDHACDGELVVTEDQLNTILEIAPITIRLVKNKAGYNVVKMEEKYIRELNCFKFNVEMVAFIEDEYDEDDFTWRLIDLEVENVQK